MNYELNKVLFALAGQHRIVDALSDEELAPYRLSPEEAAALKTGDIEALYRLGANPYLIRRVFRYRFRV
jgi:hypothetical protein